MRFLNKLGDKFCDILVPLFRKEKFNLVNIRRGNHGGVIAVAERGQGQKCQQCNSKSTGSALFKNRQNFLHISH